MNFTKIHTMITEHLLKQNRKAVDPDMGCVYRTAEGLKCAVGCLIPDEVYQPTMERRGAGMVLTLYPEVRQRIYELAEVDPDSRQDRDTLEDYLLSVQQIHDKQDTEVWDQYLKEVKTTYLGFFV